MRKSKLFRVIIWILKILAAVYVGLLLLVFFFQRKMLFHPTRVPFETAKTFASEHGFEPWQNNSGQYIGWKSLGASVRERASLLIVHGNAGSAIDRLGYADDLRKVEPVDVYILEYPGYGCREGSPSQKSLCSAADEAIGLLKQRSRVYVMGESLGTGVAAYLAGTYPDSVKGMLLIAPYNNLTDVAQTHMPIFPVKLMMWDRFPSASFLKKYHGPIAMLFAGEDVVVPNRFGHKLFDGYSGPKKSWEIPRAGHDDLLTQSEAWWQELVAFWKSGGTVQAGSGGSPLIQR